MTSPTPRAARTRWSSESPALRKDRLGRYSARIVVERALAGIGVLRPSKICRNRAPVDDSRTDVESEVSTDARYAALWWGESDASSDEKGPVMADEPSEAPVLDTLAAVTAVSIARCGLDANSLIAARIAALVAVGCPRGLVSASRRSGHGGRGHGRAGPGHPGRGRADRWHAADDVRRGKDHRSCGDRDRRGRIRTPIGRRCGR